MGIIASVKRYFNNPGSFFVRFILSRIPMSDERYIKVWYRIMYGERLDLEHPHTYNEKLQWIKLYDHNPDYTKLVDKIAVKSIVADKIGKEHVIPLIKVYDTPSDINFDELPNQFVMKCSHSGGSFAVVICKNKKELDRIKTIDMMKKAMRVDLYRNREWPYKNVPRRILVEKYMEDSKTKELRDFKFFCFDGVPKLFYVASGRTKFDEPRFDYFDMDYNHIDLKTDHPNSDPNHLPEKPTSFEEMKKLAAILSKGIPHVRVDFYEVDGKVYFGEYTFFHGSGIHHFDPEEWNIRMGEWINIRSIKN